MANRRKFGQRRPPLEIELWPAWLEAKDVRLLLRGGQERLSVKTRREMDGGRPRGFISWMGRVQEIRDIALFLQKKGILVPKIKAIDEARGLVTFEKCGTTLHDIIMKMGNYRSSTTDARATQAMESDKRRMSKLLAKAARSLAIMHSNNISHGHPHQGNIIVLGNRVGFIDFTLAWRREDVPWKEPKRIAEIFGGDYKWAKSIFAEMGSAFPKEFAERERRKFFARLLRRYPCSMQAKNKLGRIISG